MAKKPGLFHLTQIFPARLSQLPTVICPVLLMTARTAGQSSPSFCGTISTPARSPGQVGELQEFCTGNARVGNTCLFQCGGDIGPGRAFISIGLGSGFSEAVSVCRK